MCIHRSTRNNKETQLLNSNHEIVEAVILVADAEGVLRDQEGHAINRQRHQIDQKEL